MLGALAELNGDDEVLDQARKRLAKANGDVHAAIDYVEAVAARPDLADRLTGSACVCRPC